MESHMPRSLRLISHKLCPFVQRAVIVAAEKDIPVTRVDIDLANKPDWFLALSPTGKVPVLEVTDDDGSVHVLFESAVIAEYLDEIAGRPLLPSEPLPRARQRAWVEFASATLGDIVKLYSAPDAAAFDGAVEGLRGRLGQLQQNLSGPWFAGSQFGLVDAAFAPVFRYFDVFEERAGVGLRDGFPKLARWAQGLAARPSVRGAVAPDYAERLVDFARGKDSHLAGLLEKRALQAA
jgi:glutathione S-transferase